MPLRRPAAPRPRNRPQTEQRLLQAAREELVATGFAPLNRQAVAKRAGVDKALVHRYLGNGDEPLQALARRCPPEWPTPLPTTLAEWQAVLAGNGWLHAVLVWSLFSHNPVTTATRAALAERLRAAPADVEAALAEALWQSPPPTLASLATPAASAGASPRSPAPSPARVTMAAPDAGDGSLPDNLL